jgi:hypothetical protein
MKILQNMIHKNLTHTLNLTRAFGEVRQRQLTQFTKGNEFGKQ